MSESTMTTGKRTASALIATLLGVAVVGAVGLTLHSLSGDPHGKLVATKLADTITLEGKTYPKATIEMGVYPDNEIAAADKSGLAAINKNDWVHYGPATHLVLPANTYVTMTIRGYDGGEKLNSPFFGKVIGTVGGTMNVDGKDITELGVEQIQHTFTLHGLPDLKQDPLFLNIPLLRVEEGEDGFMPTTDPGTDMKGHTITFSFLTKGAGQYVWNCEFPCGDGTYGKFGAAMSAYGYMSGKVTVA